MTKHNENLGAGNYWPPVTAVERKTDNIAFFAFFFFISAIIAARGFESEPTANVLFLLGLGTLAWGIFIHFTKGSFYNKKKALKYTALVFLVAFLFPFMLAVIFFPVVLLGILSAL